MIKFESYVMPKSLLSIVIAVKNDINTINKCFQSILSQTVQDLEVIFVCEASTDGTHERALSYKNNENRMPVRVYFRELRYAYPKFRLGMLSRLLVRPNKGNFAKFTTGLKLLDRFLIRKVKPYKDFEYADAVSCYIEGLRRSRGKYILYTVPDCSFDPTFVEKCLLPMEDNEDIGICLSMTHQIGEFATINSPPLCQKTCVIEHGEGIAHFLSSSHLGGVAAIYRCKPAYHLSKTFNHFTYQANPPYRMLYESTLFVCEKLVTAVTRKTYYEGIYNQAIISERFLEIGTNIWALSTRKDLKFDSKTLLYAWKNSYHSLCKTCLDIAEWLKDRGDVEEAKAYIYFAKMLQPNVDIPQGLSDLPIIEPSYLKLCKA